MADTRCNMARRLERVREALRSHEHVVDALMLFNVEEASGENIRYLTGFTGTASICLVTNDANVILTDRRYELRVKQEVTGWDIRVYDYSSSYDNAMLDLLKEFSPRRLGLIAKETFLEREDQIREGLPEITLVHLPSILKEELRAVKDEDEVSAIREAVRMIEEVLQELYRMIVPGVTTDRQLATALRIKLIERGSDVAFPPGVVSGADSAFIHGNPLELYEQRGHDKVIQRGDIVQFDVGCVVRGYCSDISRVVVVGPASLRQQVMHGVVCEAIKASLLHYRPGGSGQEAFKEAKRVLEKYGFQLKHGLGHGLGADYHELPYANKTYPDTFQPGQLLSNEPGVYEEGYGGMRIEHDVLITETEEGHEILDTLTTDLLEVGI